MPETMSLERRKVLKALGAELVLTEGSKGMAGSIAKAEEMLASDPDRFVLLQQFKNPANPDIHCRTTGPEIWDDTEGKIDVLVSGVGTGGTITGVSRYIKGRREEDPVRGGGAGEQSGDHAEDGGRAVEGPGRIRFKDWARGLSLTRWTFRWWTGRSWISNEEAIEMARRLAKEEGILSGISCGAAAAVAVRLAKQPEFAGKTDRDGSSGRRGAVPEHRAVRRNRETEMQTTNEKAGAIG